MKEILNFLKTSVGVKVIELLHLTVNAISKLTSFLNQIVDIKQKRKKEKTQQKLKEKIDDVCDKGSLSQLLDIFCFTMLLLCGCSSEQIIIQSTKSWEGHYYSIEAAQNAFANEHLDKKESIWILSNSTLKHILKSQIKDKQ